MKLSKAQVFAQMDVVQCITIHSCYTSPTAGTALQPLAVITILFPANEPGQSMFNRIRDGPAGKGHWLLDLSLGDDLAFYQVIVEPKAKVQWVMVLATPR